MTPPSPPPGQHRKASTTGTAFALIELLVVLTVIAILAALLLPTLTKAKGDANRAVCLNNLKQINAALHMYADDSTDKSPWIGTSTNRILAFCYKELIQDYINATGADQTRQKLFACPSDTFYYDLRPQDRPGVCAQTSPRAISCVFFQLLI